MDNTDDLRVLLASRHPLIAAAMRDEARFLELLREAAAALDLGVWTWSVTRGLARDSEEPQYLTTDAAKALDFVRDAATPGVYVFADVHHALTKPEVVRRIKEIAIAAPEGVTLVLATPGAELPSDLDGLALPWDLHPPSPAELTELVERTIADLSERELPVNLEPSDVASLVDALRGLSVREAEHLVQRAAVRDGKLTTSDIAYVRSEKADLLGSEGVLELIESDHGTLDAVGGMDRLKDWLELRGKALEPEAAEFGLDPPRGVLITGIPGCGKSLVAKTLARTWGLPLVLLDPARLYGPYVGESEGKLQGALRTVDAMAPAVLWIDEIEKGFAAGGKGDSGVSQRILGTFLRWMQDRPRGTFVVATSNDVSSLPPEFARKGRFDEIFFVDLPEVEERVDILRLHLGKRNRDPEAFDCGALAVAADGFTGAELEQVVVGALYRAFAEDAELTTDGLAAEIAATVPLSRSRAEDVETLRAWASERAVPARSGIPRS